MQFNLADPATIKDAVKKQHQNDIEKKAEYAMKPDQEKDAEKPQGLAGIQNLANGLQELSEKHLKSHETYEMSG